MARRIPAGGRGDVGAYLWSYPQGPWSTLRIARCMDCARLRDKASAQPRATRNFIKWPRARDPQVRTFIEHPGTRFPQGGRVPRVIGYCSLRCTLARYVCRLSDATRGRSRLSMVVPPSDTVTFGHRTNVRYHVFGVEVPFRNSIIRRKASGGFESQRRLSAISVIYMCRTRDSISVTEASAVRIPFLVVRPEKLN